MAGASRGSNAQGWAVLSLLAGVAVVLSACHARHREAPPEAMSAAPEPKVTEEETPKIAAQKPAPSATPASTVAAANADDQQVQEDAAAAGMTSRRAASSAPAPN